MIPQKLQLKNFLSYQEASLDFTGLHTACICGPNGAGKSSLLEAIAWAIWGNSRAATEDDLISLGEKEVRVDFTFSTHGNIYRVIRGRRRGYSPTLEFQVYTGSRFKSLTEKGVRATQQSIIEHLKLDYDTFVNSAYLRQGRADEFMLKRPNERKEILASLLKLDQYDTLGEKAKDIAREFKAKVEILEQSLAANQKQLEQKEAIAKQQTHLQTTLAQLQQQQEIETQELKQFQGKQHERQTWEKLLQGQQQQYDKLVQECYRLKQELKTTQQQQDELLAVVKQENEINAGYAEFQNLQTTEENLSAKFKKHQNALNQRQQLQELQRQQLQKLQNNIQQCRAQLNSLKEQEQDNLYILSKRADIETALTQLKAARAKLNDLDKLQVEVTPLVQQRQKLQTELEKKQARLSARLEELNSRVCQLRRTQQQKQPQLQATLQEVVAEITQLDNKRVYQQRVREKGQERHQFLERLIRSKKDYETRLGELEQKLLLLNQGNGNGNGKVGVKEYPPCPLCARPLDEHHWHLVVDKHQTQQKEIRDLLWVAREQLTLSEREIKVLRTEYREIDQELAKYDELRERRGGLQVQLDNIKKDESLLQELVEEVAEIERSLHTGDFAINLYAEISTLEQQIQQFNYDDRSHSLAREEEKKLRWAEIKYGQIKDADTKLGKVRAQMPEIEEQIVSLEQDLEQQKQSSEVQKQIVVIEREISEIGYDLDEHNNIRSELRKAQFWLTRIEKLRQAQKQYPQLLERINEIKGVMENRQQDLAGIKGQISVLNEQLEQTPDLDKKIAYLDRKIQDRRQQLDQQLGSLGKVQQQLQHLENLQAQNSQQLEELQSKKRQYRVYQELSLAFGKKGIQALMIENILPQLEAETNQILARLSANQLHVQFVTQKATKGSKKNSKWIDTLDILIADTKGTRPYETYSGGEAFRVNFAIRLALSKLLAQRSGTALRLLIIDEGFGTQDAEGCDRLIAAINAIAADFSCILTVTHIPHFKEAFQARIEVSKTAQGSQIMLSV
ncbi:MAG: exonuclease subunit SbcC [Okeania sp. SIO3I5]|uniref:exonuclease subunit SbcC n=1 Tax=Okeania sp. SIO3I5 TaxID=2607805 RepID=UPI0013BB924A|nr:exonuclease subunit SbcC [Okeania sp. SIO3I5]NEQ40708.1 exonuclease subunit SbcC [Okeania sp. SIO3I5]